MGELFSRGISLGYGMCAKYVCQNGPKMYSGRLFGARQCTYVCGIEVRN